MIAIILNVIYSFVLGASVLVFFLRSEKLLSCLEFVSLSYLLGFSLITYILFILSLVGISSHLVLLVSVVVVIVLLTCLYFFKGRWQLVYVIFRQARSGVWDRFSYFVLLIIVVLVIFVFMKSFALGISMWDSWAIWSLKAKILYYKGIFPILAGGAAHSTYPLFNSFGQFWIYLLHGGLAESFGKLVVAIISVCLCVFMYSQFRKFLPIRESLIAVLFFSLLGKVLSHSTSAYSDILLAAFYFVSVVYLYKFFLRQDSFFLILSGLFLGLCGWTKNEGISFYVVNVFIFVLFLVRMRDRSFKERLVYIFIYLFIPLLFFMPWKLVTIVYGLGTDLFKGSVIDRFTGNIFDRLPVIMWTFVKVFFSDKLGFIGVLVFISYILSIRFLFRSRLIIVVFAVVFNLLVYTFVYIISPHSLEWHLNTSIYRLGLQQLPLLLYSSLVLLVKFWDRSSFSDISGNVKVLD